MGLTTVQLAVVLALATSCHAQKNNNFAPGRNSIVQMFEWSWDDIANECEQFLGPKGFAGVQISPPSENIIDGDERRWQERYQPISYSLNTRSGDEGALKDMIRRCNNAGVRIYPDLVINHMAAVQGSGTDGNSCDPGSRSYPAVPYGSLDFHASCAIENYDDPKESRNCELLDLPDLDQSKQHVRDKIVKYMNHLIGLGVAGFRVGAAKHMWPADLDAIFGSVNNLNTYFFPAKSRPFIYQEVIDFGGGNITREEYLGFGNVLEFKHGVELTKLFTGNNRLANLRNWGPKYGLMPAHDSVVFIENHDTQRSGIGGIEILTYKQPKEYKMATAFMLAHPHGETTRLFSGYSFDSDQQGPPGNGWVNEHRWSQIYNMVEFRNVVAGTKLTNWWTDGNQQIAFSRGNKGFVAFTVAGDINADIRTSLPAGTYCDLFTGIKLKNFCTGKVVKVDRSGKARVKVNAKLDGALAIHVKARL
ncbi:unnamed protein product [Acanthoscelides obtectus]|uniref:Alpha-amylase n=1 Tax=Acanthoscelides obtectus TaxID=200917 RepID=A0A9P0JVA5_ACAOB|nr:unnamed protein product [Acanthoscelides obtectus]CAK1666121.1 hypothetical protein AOBTE_LOCUS25166 [Acanthoscelides obtectus]